MTAQEQHDADIKAIKAAQAAETTARLAAETREAALIAALQAKIDAGGGASHAELMEILANAQAEAVALDETDKENPPAEGGTPTDQPEG